MRVSHYLKQAFRNPPLIVDYSKAYIRSAGRSIFRSIPRGRAEKILCFGHPLILDCTEPMQQSMARGTYSPLIESAIRRALEPGGVFFDVGSHAGYFSALACSIKDCHVTAFDPNPDRSLSLDSLQAACPGRFKYICHGVSDREDVLHFERDPHNSGMSRIVASTHAPGNTIKVPVARLDELVKKYDLPSPTVIKMDVEGHELQALLGAEKTIQTSKPVIICEISDATAAQYQFHQLADFILRNKLGIFPVEGLGHIRITLEQLEKITKGGSQDVIFLFESREPAIA